MAISPPSDLVMDVVRAADPAEVQEAQARLKANRAAFQATSLAENGDGFAAAVSVLNTSEGSSGLGDISNRAEAKKIPETYRKFEAMVLQNFVKSMLQLTPYLDRLPKALSGGQRQRVAIGRAICRNPKVFLFDEPLSNLDAALRVATRIEIAKLSEQMSDTTMIYVTHAPVRRRAVEADRGSGRFAGGDGGGGRPDHRHGAFFGGKGARGEPGGDRDQAERRQLGNGRHQHRCCYGTHRGCLAAD